MSPAGESIDDAARILGVEVSASAADVRLAYRREIQIWHPDRVGAVGTERTKALNQAYRMLCAARRSVGSAPHSAEAGCDSEVDSLRQPRLDGNDTLVLDEPVDVAFELVLAAAHDVGEVTYVDRQCGIVETLMTGVRAGERFVHSAVVNFQGRADETTEAFISLERVDGPPLDGDDLANVARAFVRSISRRRSGHRHFGSAPAS